ncbi:Endo-1,4-beta-xylanase A precursor [compost metagenome]
MMYTASTIKSLNIAGVMSWDISGDRNRTLTSQLVRDLPINGNIIAPALAAPNNLTSVSSDRSIQVQWELVSGAQAYEVYVDDALAGTVTTNTYRIPSLQPYTNYTIHLLAIAKSGDEITQVSPASKKLSVKTLSIESDNSSGSGGTTPSKPEGQLDVKVVLEGDKAVITIPADAAVVTAINSSKSSKFHIQAGTAAKQVELVIPQEVIEAIVKKGAQGTLSVLVNGTENLIPVSLLTGVGNVKITIAAPTQADTTAITGLLKGSIVLAKPTLFRIEQLNADNKVIGLKTFGKSWVNESITLPANSLVGKNLVGIVYVPATNEIRSIPTVVTVNSDGTVTVVIKKTGSGIYALIQTNIPNPLGVQSWAKEDVALAISKLITAGGSDNQFGGQQDTTRAEIVSIIVKGLGIIPSTSQTVYTDVDPQSKYAYDIASAYAAGLINGRTDNIFDPNGLITRQELAVILANAMKYAGKDKVAAASIPDTFKDQDEIAAYAKTAMALMVDHKIIQGMATDQLAPQANVTREQIIVTVMRMLRALALSN